MLNCCCFWSCSFEFVRHCLSVCQFWTRFGSSWSFIFTWWDFSVRARELFAFELIPIELLQIFPTNLYLNKFERLIWITKIGLKWWKKLTPQIVGLSIIQLLAKPKNGLQIKCKFCIWIIFRVFCKYNKHHLRFAPKRNLNNRPFSNSRNSSVWQAFIYFSVDVYTYVWCTNVRPNYEFHFVCLHKLLYAIELFDSIQSH